MRKIIVIAHNLRSTHNVGSLLRTAEGLGVETVYLTGYTPYPQHTNDTRLPHIALKLTGAIKKTALGAEISQPWKQSDDIFPVLNQLKSDGYALYALEQTVKAQALPTFKPSERCALILGSEVTGVPQEILDAVDQHIVIPMFGKKESFNVIQAAAMSLYHLRFYPY